MNNIETSDPDPQEPEDPPAEHFTSDPLWRAKAFLVSSAPDANWNAVIVAAVVVFFVILAAIL